MTSDACTACARDLAVAAEAVDNRVRQEGHRVHAVPLARVTVVDTLQLSCRAGDRAVPAEAVDDGVGGEGRRVHASARLLVARQLWRRAQPPDGAVMTSSGLQPGGRGSMTSLRAVAWGAIASC